LSIENLSAAETAPSRDLELLEISVPADMGTVACDPPEGYSKTA